TRCARPTTKQSNLAACSVTQHHRIIDTVMTHFFKTRQNGYRIRLTLSTLVLALTGCATPNPGAEADQPSQFVVHTSTGQGWQQADRASTTRPVAEPRPRRRTLPPGPA